MNPIQNTELRCAMFIFKFHLPTLYIHSPNGYFVCDFKISASKSNSDEQTHFPPILAKHLSEIAYKILKISIWKIVLKSHQTVTGNWYFTFNKCAHYINMSLDYTFWMIQETPEVFIYYWWPFSVINELAYLQPF